MSIDAIRRDFQEVIATAATQMHCAVSEQSSKLRYPRLHNGARVSWWALPPDQINEMIAGDHLANLKREEANDQALLPPCKEDRSAPVPKLNRPEDPNLHLSHHSLERRGGTALSSELAETGGRRHACGRVSPR
jgi:hypothetical protein